MKCPFCLNESYNVLSLVEVETDDCVRVCVECSNCGLRGPGAELYANELKVKLSLEELTDADQDAWKFFDEMAKVLGPIWNSKYWDEKPEEKCITIRTGGGAVWEVEGLPAGYVYEVIDEEDEDE